MEQLDKANPR